MRAPNHQIPGAGLAAVALVVLLSLAAPASAQIDASISVMAVAFPDLSVDSGRQPVTELRTRVFVAGRRDVGARVHLELSAYAEGLLARRAAGSGRDLIVRPQDLYVEYRGDHFDVRAGAARLVWGRLDEFQPTDVVNPIDLSRFLLEGRSEARLPVGLVRARWFLPGGSTLEGVLVPLFRASRFDQLDERTSPFNLSASEVRVALPVERRTPAAAWQSAQGGARLTTTIGTVDLGATAYRGFRTFPLISIDPPNGLLESFPRFTMIGGDFETVRGPWGLRGEIAAFVDDRVQSPNAATPIDTNTVEAGIGIDRKAGTYRVAANLLYSHRLEDDVSIVIATDRSFARETRTARLFAVYSPVERTTFIRGNVSASVRDNVTIEGSAAVFAGRSETALGRLTERDFIYARLKVSF